MVSFRPSPTALEVRHRHEILTIEAWGADSVRVRAAQHRIPAESHGALDEPPPCDLPQITTDKDRATFIHGDLTVHVDFDRRAAYPEPLLTFIRTSTAAELLAESREHFWLPGARVFTGNQWGTHEVHQQFAAYEGERLYGMGQRTHGRLDLKGLALDLVQRNGEVSIPFVLSSRGYGLLWNLPAVGRAEFAQNGTRWQAGQAREIDYWFTAAPTPAGILARYADATGHTPELPEWASGFWQSKLRYRDEDELLAVAREHRRRGLPLSVIVADYFHWPAMGDYRFDETEWPDPKAMVDELAALGVELMVSIWPTVSPLSEHFADYRDGGLLVGTSQGVEFHQTIQDKGMAAPLPVAFYDPTNPRTRQFVWDLVRRNYRDLGIRVFWLDACEPELNPAHPGHLSLYAGPGAEVAGIYPRDNARLFAEGMAADGEPTVLLCRSAWAGAQKYGAALWSGDIPATWQSLRQQIRAGLSVAVSGIPWWTTDIGGFHGGDARDPAYRELMIRWFQFGVFCPLFRLHGDREPRNPTSFAQTGGPNEVWSYGEEAYDIISGLLHLRERLRPYIHEQMRTAARTGLPPMRPLFLDHPEDPHAWVVDDEFLFGPDILVAPVAQAGQRSREVYLPADTRWVCAASGEVHEGGRTVTAPAPIDHIPVFTREGADLPLTA
ncbi:glycoside hydrolase family 31 protein [Streptomyces sp. PSKA54]|uniref:Glycoside hydrolase family 31 protein n=1 Tax=Streptomyces himalayensis subsp. aureolus TaxID=2758039 RepID=A0A7W2D514_9ACTN|nr:glycoside hydrolase family 31 protein [Streptomyces himalayensis]MBA4864729.1 glycoside hydrolase family 31 protein [Streptomyces himalayensis subsp. aureolus]